MARRQSATLKRVHPAPPYWEVQLALPQPPQPGTYVLADLGEPVREAFFPSHVTPQGFTTVVQPGHPITRLLPGTAIDLIGPLGRGFRLEGGGYPLDRLLLIAEAAHSPWLMPLTQAAPSVAFVLEASTRSQLPSPSEFPPALELTMVTRDGSAGYLGPLEVQAPAPPGMERAFSHICDLIAWADRICIADDYERYGILARLIRDVRLQPQKDFAQGLVRVSMPCGVGVCDVCRISTRYGERRACVDGPVFDILDFLP